MRWTIALFVLALALLVGVVAMKTDPEPSQKVWVETLREPAESDPGLYMACRARTEPRCRRDGQMTTCVLEDGTIVEQDESGWACEHYGTQVKCWLRDKR